MPWLPIKPQNVQPGDRVRWQEGARQLERTVRQNSPDQRTNTTIIRTGRSEFHVHNNTRMEIQHDRRCELWRLGALGETCDCVAAHRRAMTGKEAQA
jgi:hypothetical protein